MDVPDSSKNSIEKNDEAKHNNVKGHEDSKLKRKGSVDVVYPNGQPPEEVALDPNAETSDEFTEKNRSGLLKVLTNAVGFDVSTISVPVTVNEPASFLMRLCEQLQYSDLLDKAAGSEDSLERLTYIATFAITCYAVAERTGKPFNPILGETFEYVDEKRDDFKFLGEQVSHHPPIGACHCENNQWKFWEAQCLKSKFTGNSLDCSVVGSNNVLIKSTGEHFKWEAVKTAVHNIILGTLWLDHYGETIVLNKKTGEKAVINFKPCGWFSKGWHEVTGDVFDAQGHACISLVGKWNESIHAKALSKYAERLKAEKDEDSPINSPGQKTESSSGTKKEDKKQKKEKKKAEQERKKEAKQFRKALKKKLLADEAIWTHTYKALSPEKLGVKYLVDWTEHTLEVVALPENMRPILPPTDSRVRPDRLALEKGDAKTAASEKNTLEEKQREERKRREKSGIEWTPKWFKLSVDSDGQDFYEYVGGYWEERTKRIEDASTK